MRGSGSHTTRTARPDPRISIFQGPNFSFLNICAIELDPRHVRLFGCSSDSCSVNLAALKYSGTPKATELNAGYKYLGLADEDYCYFAVYYSNIPFAAHADWEHLYRTARRGLHNPRTLLAFGCETVGGEVCYDVASWGVIEELRGLLGERGGYLDSVLKYNSFMDQSGDAANRLFNKRTIVALNEQYDKGLLPDAAATLLYLTTVNSIIAPIEDPDFGTPFECVQSMWKGLHALRLWRKSVVLNDKLTLGENFVSLAMYETCEIIVHGATNHYLIVFRHAGDVSWRKKGPLRNVPDTRAMEGEFGAVRVGKIGHHNSVNIHAAGFLDILAKNVASKAAKAGLLRAGLEIGLRKGKAETWKVKEGSVDMWAAFGVSMNGVKFDDFSARLSSAKQTGQRDAEALIERLAPKMAALLKAMEDGEPWKTPMPRPQWRADFEKAGIKFVTVSGDEAVLEHRLPINPTNFQIDPAAAKEADAAAQCWQENAREQGLSKYVAESSVPTRCKPRSPALAAHVSVGSASVEGALLSSFPVDGKTVSVVAIEATTELEKHFGGFSSAPAQDAVDYLFGLDPGLLPSLKLAALSEAGFHLTEAEVGVLSESRGGTRRFVPEWARTIVEDLEGSAETSSVRVHVGDDNKTVVLDQRVIPRDVEPTDNAAQPEETSSAAGSNVGGIWTVVSIRPVDTKLFGSAIKCRASTCSSTPTARTSLSSLLGATAAPSSSRTASRQARRIVSRPRRRRGRLRGVKRAGRSSATSR